jgi:hypothetical protein
MTFKKTCVVLELFFSCQKIYHAKKARNASPFLTLLFLAGHNVSKSRFFFGAVFCCFLVIIVQDDDEYDALEAAHQMVDEAVC